MEQVLWLHSSMSPNCCWRQQQQSPLLLQPLCLPFKLWVLRASQKGFVCYC